MKYLSFIALLFVFGCNPFPKKDAHPEVPLLTELLKDETKFRKVAGNDGISEHVFLSDDKILLKPDNSNSPLKIIDLNGKVIFNSFWIN